MEHPFTDTGFQDVLVGAELFRALRIDEMKLIEPNNIEKIREIAEYLNSVPDPMFEISKILGRNRNPDMNGLDFFASYISLKKRKAELAEQLEKVENELAYYG